jgi:glycosyltransferase involved in cell wall biosynthesis
MIRVAILTTDSREHYGDYENPKPYFGSAPEALLAGMAGLPELEVHVVSCLQRPVSSPEKLSDNIWYHGPYVPKLGWMRTGYQGCVRAVKRVLARVKPAVVHGQGTERDCALAAVRSGFPNLITIHGHMRRIAELTQARPFSYYWWMSRIERYAVRRSGGVLCISEYTRRIVRGQARRTWLVPNAVEPGFFSVVRHPVTEDAILCVGNICPWKNQNRFIQALDSLSGKRPFRLIFVGGVEQDDYGREFLELVRARPWCDYRGFADRESLKTLLGSASVLALPSLEDNCPMAVLEAMAAGVPVVAAKVGGVPDLVQDGESGLLFEPEDAVGMSRMIERCLEQPDFAVGLAARARLEAETRFHPLAVARRHIEIYQELLSSDS